jgi:Gluconolactonase
MKKSIVVFLALMSGLAAAAPELIWEAKGFVGPESVVYDETREVLYVSNMGTHGEGQTVGDGFISRVSVDGKILEPRWVTGFDNPKGLALANGRLYVGDDRDLVEIDVAAGKVVGRYAPEDGPGDFNDCTADPEGNVYVSSGRLGEIFRLSGGKFESWTKLDRSKTGWINGLRAEKDRLLLGGWTVRGADGKEQLGHISILSFKDKSLSRIGSEPVCHVDGIEPDGKNGYTVTDWISGDVLHVSAEGKVTPVMKLVKGTADHEYIVEKKEMLVPLMNDNVLRAYRWAPES